MTLAEFKVMAEQDRFTSNIYIFSGNNDAVKRKYIDRLHAKRIDSLDSLVRSLFSGDSGVYWIRQQDFTVIELAHTDLRGRVLIVYCDGELDKRSALYRDYKNNIVEFIDLTEKQLCSYVISIVNSKKFAPSIIENCGGDVGRADTEADKINRLNSPTQEQIDQLIVKEPRNKIFELFVELLNRDIVPICALYKDLKDLSIEDTVICSVLWRQFKDMFLIQAYLDCGSSTQFISEKIGLPVWKIDHYTKHCNRHNSCEYATIVEMLYDAEVNLKTEASDIKNYFINVLLDIVKVLES